MMFGDCAVSPCADQVVSGNPYTICRFELDSSKLRLFLNKSGGKPYGSIPVLRQSLNAQGKMLLFAMNGGMYHADLSPVGLYIEKGLEKKRISTKGGYGNFHLLPNGIFYFDGNKAGVMETNKYKSSGIKPQFATQSGPMLVINGKLHPKFLQNSNSFKIRNGVGVSKDGKTVYFAISHYRVRFWDFGKLFQGYLKTPNALFLDGSISTLQAPGFSQGGYLPLGPIIAVTD
jgi:uncharacterized protein YigE (DUF2233 family)